MNIQNFCPIHNVDICLNDLKRKYLQNSVSLPNMEKAIHIELSEKSWKEIDLGVLKFCGIFLLVGKNSETNEIICYIGHSSQGYIATNLYQLLKDARIPNKKGFRYAGGTVILHHVYALDFSQDHIEFFSSAAKDYLLSHCPIQLLNVYGTNYNVELQKKNLNSDQELINIVPKIEKK